MPQAGALTMVGWGRLDPRSTPSGFGGWSPEEEKGDPGLGTQEPQGRPSWAQGLDLKQKAEEKEIRMSSQDVGKSYMDSWRPAAEDTQPPHLPFIYCVFNSEHLIESLPGWQRLGRSGRASWGWVMDSAPLLPRAPLLPAFLLHLPGPEPDGLPNPNIPG